MAASRRSASASTARSLTLIDPVTLEVLATYDLPPRNVSANPFRDFSGGGYFYLDNQDRAVTPTSTRHVFVVAQTGGPGFELERDYDLSGVVPQGDGIISALPDWDGRIWFASSEGRRRLDRPGERRGHVAQPRRGDHELIRGRRHRRRLHRHRQGALPLRRSRGRAAKTWRRAYDNNGVDEAGPDRTRARGRRRRSMGRNYVAITDNADPMQIVARRHKRRQGKRRRASAGSSASSRCSQPAPARPTSR